MKPEGLHCELVADGLELPEGPVWLQDGTVLVCEISRGTIARCFEDGEVERMEIGGGPNGMAVGADGALYVCNNGGGYLVEREGDRTRIKRDRQKIETACIQRVDFASGEVRTLYRQSDGKALVGPNDIVVDRGGGLWFTDTGDFAYGGEIYGSIHYASADGADCHIVRRGVVSPNGIGLSPDESVLYVADTRPGILWAFDIVGPGQLAPEPGPYCPGRLVHTFAGHALDSLAVEEGGSVCIATLAPGGICVFSDVGGGEFLAIENSRITNLCFGGIGDRDVWLTDAEQGRLLKARWPRPGLKLNFNA